MQHTEFLQTTLLQDNRKLIEIELRNMMKHTTSLELVAERLRYIYSEFGCSFLGYQLIRYLHTKHSIPTAEEDSHLILGQTFAAQNTTAPSKASIEEKKRYAQILADLVMGNTYDPVERTYAIALFEAVLIENRFLEKDGDLRPITKWDAYDIAHMLSMSLSDAEMLVGKAFTDGSLSVLNARNLIEKFSFISGLSKAKRDALLSDYMVAAHGKRRTAYKDRQAGVTGKIGKAFSDILKNKDTLKTEAGYDTFFEKLVKETPRLKGHSNTARIIFEQILLFAAKLSSSDFYPGDASEETVFRDLKEFVNLALMNFSEKNGDYQPLSGEARGELFYALLCQDHGSDLKATYYSWSVPVWTGSGIKKDPLGSRIETVLTGTEAVRKEDILIALFLVCSKFWGSKQGKVSSGAAAKLAHSTVTERLKLFINAANLFLKQASLEKFYLPHPTEAVITYAILGRGSAEDVYLDSMDKIPENPAVIYYSTTNPSRFGIPESSRTFIRLSTFDQEQQDLFRILEGKIRRFLYRAVYSNPDNDLMLEIKSMAKQIHEVYVSEEFSALDIYFTEREQNGSMIFECGYIPAINIGRSYLKIAEVSGDFHKILIGEQKLGLLFRETRIPKQWRDDPDKEALYVPRTIEDRYPEIKDLEEALQQLISTKALLVLLQREIIPLLGLSPSQESVEGPDPIDDPETDIMKIAKDSAIPETEEEMEADEEHRETAFPFPVEISVGKHIIFKLPVLDNVTFSADKRCEIKMETDSPDMLIL